MFILGLETSCDETAVALVQNHPDPLKRILAQNILSQCDVHKPFGGVVPEMAARAHLNYLAELIEKTLLDANLSLKDVEAIAVTGGPGLIGGLLIGLVMAKAIAAAMSKPFLAINHLEGHALTVRLTHKIPFPYLLLLASGGHCQFIEVHDLGNYHLLGRTIDDAAGEAFDKVAKLLELGYPGGPQIEILAKEGDMNRFAFPRPLKGQKGCDLSFSGLKTAVRVLIEKISSLITNQDKKDIAASFQKAVSDCFMDRMTHALQVKTIQTPYMVIAGGVAANVFIKEQLEILAKERHMTLITPPLKLCTDNAAMIAWAGLEKYAKGYKSTLDFAPQPRWPLTKKEK